MTALKSCFKSTILLLVFLSISCGNKAQNQTAATLKTKNNSLKQNITKKELVIAANKTATYLPLLNGKRIGIVANQTSLLQQLRRKVIAPNVMGSEMVDVHLVDFLNEQPQVNVLKVFAPEHGFRGKADAGELVKNGIDTKTKLPIISLYGKNKKPSKAQLQDLDIIVFDIQDVGARFYTYISSLHYVMEAAAENHIKVIVLDRPNPNGHIVDGPILNLKHQSFIGMHPIPVLHGMTIGEYAKMINGESWLKNKIKCDLEVITMDHYNHNLVYSLPVKPSPNLPNDKAINLYASLCFFEGTNVSAGRGTEMQFQIYGAPFLPKTNFSFTPQPNEGAKYPKHKNELCNGYDLTEESRLTQLNLSYLINAYKLTPNKSNFFLKNGFFTKLAGTELLQVQVESGKSEASIRKTWQKGLDAFNVIRSKYLMYR